jgi:branched-chain amino acid transport system ATP-binding protein
MTESMGATGATTASATAPAIATATTPLTDGDVLRANHVTKRFGGLLAVNKVDFTIPPRSIVSLIGPNGAGKTTFFNIIAGIYDPTAGVIEFGGEVKIARSKRAWLEPLLWLVLPAIVGILTVLAALGGAAESIVIIGLFVTVLVLLTVLVTGVARPPWYQRMLTNVGIFRSARPNDMVVAGLGRTFQNIRLFANMTAMENVLVGMHARLKASWIDALLSTPSASRASTTSSRRTFRTATSDDSRSPVRSRRTRPSSCSTSRPPG